MSKPSRHLSSTGEKANEQTDTVVQCIHARKNKRMRSAASRFDRLNFESPSFFRLASPTWPLPVPPRLEPSPRRSSTLRRSRARPGGGSHYVVACSYGIVTGGWARDVAGQPTLRLRLRLGRPTWGLSSEFFIRTFIAGASVD